MDNFDVSKICSLFDINFAEGLSLASARQYPSSGKSFYIQTKLRRVNVHIAYWSVFSEDMNFSQFLETSFENRCSYIVLVYFRLKIYLRNIFENQVGQSRCTSHYDTSHALSRLGIFVTCILEKN